MKGRNPNHPAKGSHIAVEPIRSLEDIRAIKQLLADNPRNELLFVMGINNGLRVGDLLKLRVEQVESLKVGDVLTIKEGKTGKTNVLCINKAVHKSLQKYINASKPRPEDYLFRSAHRRTALTVIAVNALVKKWTRAINLKGRYGAHTLRKTFGYQQRVQFGVGFEVIARRFNHSNPAVTMRYIGIEDKEVHQILLNEIG